MAKTIIMYNKETNKSLTTNASFDGPKFKKLIENGYKPITIAYNVGVVGIGLSEYIEEDHKKGNYLK